MIRSMIKKFKQNRILREYGHAASVEISEADFWKGTGRERDYDKMIRQMSVLEVATMMSNYAKLKG